MRFVTALVLMGLLLGAGGARTGLSGPAVTATESRPATAQSTVQDARAGADAVLAGPAVRTGSHAALDGPSGAAVEPTVVMAEQPSTVFEGAVAADERTGATGPVVPTVLVRADLLGGQPDRPVLGAAAGVWPAGNAHARVVGPRAPPLG
ncbi:hypothetical protein [Plantactinospora mayteni]|uniref:hypothetical protein n=1 Tax=Plantactinospora mayteni TaxID=566021 RepID=UPI0019445D82|nr:hypothetical protein [Plantactinospora mayteni]